MKLTKERQKNTGAFYTPKYWAELAVRYIEKCLPKDLIHYTFYDPFAGEGALLEALPNNLIKFGSTLEFEDFEILESKEIQAYNIDFFDIRTAGFLESLAPINHELIIFTNPPYMTLPKGKYEEVKKLYPEARSDAEALALLRLAKELNPAMICSFDKLTPLVGSTMVNWRKEFFQYYKLVRVFITPSFNWEGLSGKFPIGFHCYVNRFNFEILAHNWDYLQGEEKRGRIRDEIDKKYNYKIKENWDKVVEEYKAAGIWDEYLHDMPTKPVS